MYPIFLKAQPMMLFVMFNSFAASSPSLAASPDCWVYFGTYTGGISRGIYASRLEAAGKLSEPKLVAVTTHPSFLAVDPKHRFLYAISEVNDAGTKQGDVIAYSIDIESGNLTKINEQLSGGESLCHVHVDATGKTVLVASYGGGSLTSLPVNGDGGLGKAASFIQHHGSSVNPLNQKGPHAHCIVTSPDNRFALACDLGLDQVLVYKLNATTATLAPNTPAFAVVAPGSGPRHLAFHPNGRFVYVINEMGCNLTVFDYDAKQGALSEIQTITTLAGQKIDPAFSGAEVVAHPSGKFLYSSTRGLDVISVYSIEANSGALTHLENIPCGGKTPRNFNLDPTGNFLFCANQNSDNVSVFKINLANGRLTATGQSVTVGNPSCVIFVPTR